MSKLLYEEDNIRAIANAIRAKNGLSETYQTSQMPNAILNIVTQPELIPLSVNQNGSYVPPDGKDGFSQVIVTVTDSLPYAAGVSF